MTPVRCIHLSHSTVLYWPLNSHHSATLPPNERKDFNDKRSSGKHKDGNKRFQTTKPIPPHLGPQKMSRHPLGAALPAHTELLIPIKNAAVLNLKTAPTSPQLSLTQTRKPCPAIRAVSIDEIPPNALRRKRDSNWRGGFSVGVDLGLSRTGLALSKGFSVRPLTVLNLRGQKLEVKILEIAKQEEADEFIIGLPKSSDGKETPQSNKVRSVAGRLAATAAERGWRVYLQDENGTSIEAMDRMINILFPGASAGLIVKAKLMPTLP
ncbi:uncharacterized protein LOC112176257 isoform X2 [Rosa chinensis]|uniref:uncharacterized protein LOC112176257 isoform X2 n=1 Tax=Rosa chinensis TaxID=74649 RepID=UPI001AD9344B|nr:uncharacterized protein LOC112176257 isoform X2 [Rosa chinensis]